MKEMITIYIDSIKNPRKIFENVIANSICYDCLTRSLMFDFYYYDSNRNSTTIYSHIVKFDVADSFYLKSQENYK